MQLFTQLFLLGCATGAIYAISAMGLVLVFRSSGVINFAQGTLAMMAGYVTYWLATEHGLPYVVAIIAGIAVSAALGYLMYALIISRLGDSSALTKVISTLGVFVILQQVVLLVFGSSPRAPNSFLPTNSLKVGGTGVGADQAILFGFAVVLTTVLWWVYRYTTFGVATSAVAESPRSLAALGWRVERLRALNWTLGGALAGVAGVALAPLLQLQPGTFALLIIPTLASAMLGGLRSFPLTLLGGVVLGVLQAEAPHYIDLPGVGDAVPFLVIVLVLVFMGRSLPLRDHINERLPRVGAGDIKIIRLVLTCVIVAFLVLYVLGPDLLNGVQITVLAGMIMISQVVVTGYAGQLSLAQVPISGVAAIFAGRAVADHDVPFWGALIIGAFVGMLASFVLGLPSLRARGVSLAIATLGLGVAANAVILRNPDLTGGVAGTNVGFQTFLGIDINAILYPQRYVILCGVILVLTFLVAANVRRGRSGRRMLAVRNNERAAASLGVNVAMTKLYAFTLAGGIAGVGGVLTAFQYPSLTFTSYDALSSVVGLTQSVIGGIGYLIGAVIAAIGANGGLVTAITNIWFFNVTGYLTLALGVLLIVTVITNPNGVADVIATKNAEKGPGRLQRLVAKRLGNPTWFDLPAVRRQRRDAAELEAGRATQTKFEGGVLEVNDITVRFGSVTAVDGVSLTARPGEIVSIIGPNGAGKTTLMDAISGFVASTGAVTIDGKSLNGMSAYRRTRSGLTRSFQSLELLEDMSVLDNLRCACDPTDAASYVIDLVRPGRRTLTAATAAAVDAFRLEPDLHRLPTEISYGTRHLVAVARAVAAAPRVLMLDEPAAGLAEEERAELGGLIRLMAKEWGITVLLIEHDVELVRSVSDRVVVLDFGAVIATGKPDDVLADPRVITAYLGQPVDEPTRAEAV